MSSFSKKIERLLFPCDAALDALVAEHQRTAERAVQAIKRLRLKIILKDHHEKAASY